MRPNAPGRDARVRRDAEHRQQRRPRPGRADRDRPRGRLAAPTASSSGGLDMPSVGDELHHFGWNACSSRAVPVGAASARRAPLPARARACAPRTSTSSTSRATPGRSRSSSRPYRRRGDRRARPATRGRTPSTAGRTGSTSPRSATPRATGPGGIFLLDHDDFSVKGPWEDDRGPQELAYDFWWHLNYGTVITSEWGTPKMVEDGLVGELLLGNKYGHKLHVWDLEHAPPRPGDRPRPGEPDGARAAARARPVGRRTGSSASWPRPPTSRPRSGCGSAAPTAP